MIVTNYTRQALMLRRERRDLEAKGYRRHETDWEIDRGGLTDHVIAEAHISSCGKYVYTRLAPGPSRLDVEFPVKPYIPKGHFLAQILSEEYKRDVIRQRGEQKAAPHFFQSKFLLDAEIPMPPSINRNTRFGKNGAYSSPEYKSWQKEVGLIFMAAKAKEMTPPYRIAYTVGRPDKRQRDIDNLIKPLNDALQRAGILTNDSLVEELSIRWDEAVPKGMVVVYVGNLRV